MSTTQEQINHKHGMYKFVSSQSVEAVEQQANQHSSEFKLLFVTGVANQLVAVLQRKTS